MLANWLDENQQNKITKIQTHIRKKYVQREMIKLRSEYEKIFHDIEGENGDTRVVWPIDEPKSPSRKPVLCYPKFIPAKQAQTKPSELNHSTELIKFTGGSSSSQAGNDLKQLKIDIKDLDEESVKFFQLDNLKKMSHDELLNVRESISLELLWIQQAIQSRVQYLKLKKSLQCKKSIHQTNEN